VADKTEIKNKILTEEDYIRCPKFDNSIVQFLADKKNTEDIDTYTISRLLMLTEEEVEKIYQEAVQMLRDDMVGE
jgi:hypothetical protein